MAKKKKAGPMPRATKKDCPTIEKAFRKFLKGLDIDIEWDDSYEDKEMPRILVRIPYWDYVRLVKEEKSWFEVESKLYDKIGYFSSQVEAKPPPLIEPSLGDFVQTFSSHPFEENDPYHFALVTSIQDVDGKKMYGYRTVSATVLADGLGYKKKYGSLLEFFDELLEEGFVKVYSKTEARRKIAAIIKKSYQERIESLKTEQVRAIKYADDFAAACYDNRTVATSVESSLKIDTKGRYWSDIPDCIKKEEN